MSNRRDRDAVPTEPDQPGIDRLVVRDFKSLLDIDVELGRVNVFVGANGSGKSNLLEAIGILGAAAAGRIDDQALLRRGVRPGVPELYKTALKLKKKMASYISLEAHGTGGVNYHANIHNPSKTPKPWWIFWHETLAVAGSSVASRSPKGASILGRKVEIENHSSIVASARSNSEAPAAIRPFLDLLDDYAIFSPVTPVLRGIAPDNAPRAPVGLFGGQLPEAVSWMIASEGREEAAGFFNEALRFVTWARAFGVGPPTRRFISPSVPTMRLVMRFQDKFMVSGRNTLSGYDASEGALYVLFMLVLALHDQSPRTFAIDNFDQALNPLTAKGLTTVFANACLARGRQAFLTTHNPLVLDGLPLQDERVRLFAVDRAKNGATRVRHIPVRDLATLKKRHGEDIVSRLWLSGRLGGMPVVKV